MHTDTRGGRGLGKGVFRGQKGVQSRLEETLLGPVSRPLWGWSHRGRTGKGGDDAPGRLPRAGPPPPVPALRGAGRGAFITSEPPTPKPRLSPLLARGEAVVQKQEPSLQTACRGPGFYYLACPVSLTHADFLVRELEADARSLLRVLLPRLSSVHRTGPALLL